MFMAIAGLLKVAAPIVAGMLGGDEAEKAVEFLGDELLGDPKATPDQVEAAVRSAPPSKLATLDRKLDMYKAETERLRDDQGVVGETLQAKLDTETANEVVYLRSTTRPWAVRQMVRVLMIPIYIISVDISLTVINIFITFFSDEKSPKQLQLLAQTFFSEGSIYLGMYEAAATPAAAIVMSYMGLRQIEKSGNPIKGVTNLVKKIFNR